VGDRSYQVAAGRPLPDISDASRHSDPGPRLSGEFGRERSSSIQSGCVDLDPAWLRVLRLGNAQRQHTVLELRGYLASIEFLG